MRRDVVFTESHDSLKIESREDGPRDENFVHYKYIVFILCLGWYSKK